MKKNMKSNKAKIGCICAIVAAVVVIVLSFCGRYFSGGFRAFCNFFVGTFGMSLFGIAAAVIVACSFVLSGRKIIIPAKYIANFCVMYIIVTLMVHTYSTLFLYNTVNGDFSQYVLWCYDYYGVPTFGGVTFGSVAFALQSVLTVWGSSVLLFAGLAITVYFAAAFFYDYASHRLVLTGGKHVPVNRDMQEEETENEDTVSSETTRESVAAQQQGNNRAIDILFNEVSSDETDDTEEKYTSEQYDVAHQSPLNNSAQRNVSDATSILFSDEEPEETSSQTGNGFFRGGNVGKPTVDNDDDDFIISDSKDGSNAQSGNDNQGYNNGYDGPRKDFPLDDTWLNGKLGKNASADDVIALGESRYDPATATNHPENQAATQNEQQTYQKATNQDYYEVTSEESTDDEQKDASEKQQSSDKMLPIEEIIASYDNNTEESEETEEESTDEQTEEVAETAAAPTAQTDAPQNKSYTVTSIETPVEGGVQVGFNVVETAELEEKKNSVHQYLEYQKPPVELLNDETIRVDNNGEARRKSAEAIVNKLAVFGIQIEALDPIVGPSVTQYRFRLLSEKIRMSSFQSYADDLKSCLEAKDDIIIQAPIPGTNLIGIEVANKEKTPVVLRSVLESNEFKNGKGKLVFAIGQEVSGKYVVSDLADMPHLLVAGTTGSGKSVCLNCMIVSLMYKYSPEYVRFLMVDPKFVELSRYNGSPHLLTSNAITTVQEALQGMDYLIGEMEARYQLLREYHVDNIAAYNKAIDPRYVQKLPYIVLVVDELADLMAVSKKAFENKLMRLAQKSRAAGIHIVLATQRPSVDIITGTIKANLPCRMALKVTTAVDSKTILDGGGAEKLLGKGDMLLMESGSPTLNRVQGAYVSNDEIRTLIDYLIAQNEVYYREDVAKAIFAPQQEEEEAPAVKAEPAKESQIDPYCKRALRFWLEKNNGKASIASIQRSLNVGFNRAGKIFEALVSMGYVEEVPANESNSKPRRVLVSLNDLDTIFPDQEG